MKISVFAPFARQVELETAGERLALAPGPRGHWAAESTHLAHGADYRLFLDGKGPFPDPRSPWQPEGPFGPSRAVDHARFSWSDAGFRAPPLAAGVLYELHTGTFTAEGTFDAAIERLPHLAALGVTHIELLPVAEAAGARGWGYDGVDLFAPHHAYGGPDALKRFVDASHRAGLAVVLDVVYNHLGPSGNVLAGFGPYFTGAYQTPWGAAVNLDGRGSDEVRRFLCDNALMWLRDYHMDGLRLDAVHCFQEHSAVRFLEQLAGEVHALERLTGKSYGLIAESDYNDPRMVRPLDAGGSGMDAQWSDDFHHALHAALTGETAGFYADYGGLAPLAKTLEDVFFHDGGYSEFRQKSHGRPAGDTPRGRFVAFLQNHDQTGNRPGGERIAALVGPARAKIGAAILLASPFLPMLFQGEEWGARTPFHYFTDHDAGLGRAIRDGRRDELRHFGWPTWETPDPQSPATFAASRLDWREAESPAGQDMLAWHRALIALRRGVGPGGGRAQVRFDDAAGWLVLRNGNLAVAANLGRAAATVPLPAGAWAQALAAGGVAHGRGGAQAVDLEPDAVARDTETVRLGPDAVAVFQLRNP